MNECKPLGGGERCSPSIASTTRGGAAARFRVLGLRVQGTLNLWDCCHVICCIRVTDQVEELLALQKSLMVLGGSVDQSH